MDARKKRKRAFGAAILLLLAVLAVGTAVFAKEGKSHSSYSMMIQKKLADSSPEAARDKEYTFQIEGITQTGGEYKKVEKTVTITGEGEAYVEFDGPTEITVVELSDDIPIEVGNEKWNMTTTQCESQMQVPGQATKISISKDGGKIRVKRPEDAQTVTYFQVTGRDFANGDEIYDSGLCKIEPGGEKLLEGLKRGEYIVKELKAPEGFAVTVGPRIANVEAGKIGSVHINGDYGAITITAPGTLGSNDAYYYTIKRDGNVYERAIRVKAGEAYKLEHLPRGMYTVTEYRDNNTGYQVLVPQTIEIPVEKNIKRVESGTGKNVDVYRLFYTIPKSVTYAKLRINFPYDKDGPDRGTPCVACIKGCYVQAPTTIKGFIFNGKVGYPKNWSNYSLLPGKVYLKIRSSDAPIRWVKITLTECTETINDFLCESEQPCTKTIDSRGWMEISKEVDNSEGAENVTYYYTLKDEDKNIVTVTDYTITDEAGNSVATGSITDKADTTVMLKAGQRVRLNGLKEGSYEITESLHQNSPAAFEMMVEEEEKNTTGANAGFNLEVLGERTLTIKKPKGEDGGRTYDFNIFKADENGNYEWDGGKKINPVETITLHAGESDGTFVLQPGKYLVEASDDGDAGFSITFSDSSTVQVFQGSVPTVTITNAFTRNRGAYRVIHEYYLRDSDDHYTYEGSSALSTMYGELDGVVHDSGEVTKYRVFNGHTYNYMEDMDAYGIVEKQAALAAAGGRTSTSSNAASSGGQGQNTGNRPENATSSNATPSNVRLKNNGNKQRNASSGGAMLLGREFGRQAYSYSSHGENATSSNAVDRSPIPSGASGFDGSAAVKKEVLSDGAGTDEASTKGASSARAAREPDENGILTEGYGDDASHHYKYQPDDGMASVVNTEDGSQIIILRYYRNDTPEIITGSYKVIHVYYLRDKHGSHWEGSSVMESVDVGQLTDIEKFKKHEAKDVGKETNPTNFSVDGTYYTYTYDTAVYGKVTQSENTDPYPGEGNAGEGWHYEPDSKMRGAYATPEGDQIIILRYYRELEDSVVTNGFYNVVHEYYFRNKEHLSEDFDDKPGTNAIPETEGDLETEGIPEGDKMAPAAFRTVSEPLEGQADAAFGGTLVNTDEYVYTFEGRTDIEHISAPLDGRYTKADVEEKLVYTPDGSQEAENYTYYNVGYGRKADTGYECISNKQWAAATEQGEEIIILRYYRQGEDEPEEPDVPDKPKPEEPNDPKPEEPNDPKPEEPSTDPSQPKPSLPSGGGGGGGSTPTPTTAPSPDAVPTPAPIVEEVTEPANDPDSLPDPNAPNSPERITIWEGGVPKTYVKVWDSQNNEWVYLPESQVPLIGRMMPKTGDHSKTGLWALLFLGASGSICLLKIISMRKKKQEIE